MKLTRNELKSTLSAWYTAWNNHDLEEVMALFHDDVFFCHWSGQKVQGKNRLKKAWSSWFKSHGNFVFRELDTFVDESRQKAAFHWELAWPSIESGFIGQPEIREGVDLIQFQDGKIIKKLSFSKTLVDIGHQKIKLSAM